MPAYASETDNNHSFRALLLVVLQFLVFIIYYYNNFVVVIIIILVKNIKQAQMPTVVIASKFILKVPRNVILYP